MFFAFPIAFSEIRGWSEGMTGIAFVSIMVRLATISSKSDYQLYPRSWVSSLLGSFCLYRRSSMLMLQDMERSQRLGCSP